MSYATLADLEERYGHEEILLVGDRDHDGEIDEAVVDRALQDAADEIDAHISTRYALPLPHTPPILRRLACAMALYYLSSDAASLTEEKANRFDHAVKTLKLIARGEAKLGLPEAQVPKTSARPAVDEGRADFAGWGGL